MENRYSAYYFFVFGFLSKTNNIIIPLKHLVFTLKYNSCGRYLNNQFKKIEGNIRLILVALCSIVQCISDLITVSVQVWGVHYSTLQYRVSSIHVMYVSVFLLMHSKQSPTTVTL